MTGIFQLAAILFDYCGVIKYRTLLVKIWTVISPYYDGLALLLLDQTSIDCQDISKLTKTHYNIKKISNSKLQYGY